MKMTSECTKFFRMGMTESLFGDRSLGIPIKLS